MSELHAFVTAVRLGSFTRAADALCLTQGAISRAIARLEAHFGQPLLQRNAHGLALTAAGQQLLDAVAQPLQVIEGVSAQLRAGYSRDALCLAVVPTLASVWLVPRLPAFHQRHPDIALTFAAYRRDEDFSGLAPDAAILAGVPGQWPRLHCDYIIGRDVVVICHPDRLKARRAVGRWKKPAELLDEPLLYHANARENWRQWFAAVGVDTTPTLSTGMDQVSIIVRAVMADMGIAVLQRCLVHDEIESGHVAVPFDIPVSIQHGYVLCYPERHSHHPALSAFREWLLEVAAES